MCVKILIVRDIQGESFLLINLGSAEDCDLLLIYMYIYIYIHINIYIYIIRDKIRLSTVIHCGTLLGNKISISLKINFQEEEWKQT